MADVPTFDVEISFSVQEANRALVEEALQEGLESLFARFSVVDQVHASVAGNDPMVPTAPADTEAKPRERLSTPAVDALAAGTKRELSGMAEIFCLECTGVAGATDLIDYIKDSRRVRDDISSMFFEALDKLDPEKRAEATDNAAALPELPETAIERYNPDAAAVEGLSADEDAELLAEDRLERLCRHLQTELAEFFWHELCRLSGIALPKPAL